MENNELEVLLNENLAQILKKFVRQLGISTIFI